MVSLVIRADGGPEVGAGHLGRCLALAEVWRDRGGEVTLVSHEVPEHWARRYQDEGVAVREPETGWADLAADWIAIDGYGLAREEGEARAAGHRILAIDDFGIGRPHDADLVLDQNLDVHPDTYALPALLGPRHALLRREFRRNTWQREVSGKAEHLLLAIGGFPAESVAALTKEALRRAKSDFVVEPLAGRDEVTPAMAAADMALAASGSTVWELCCAGVPAVLISTAPNQRPVAVAAAGHGVAEDAGSADELTPDDLARDLDALAGDAVRREAMVAAGQRLVDGRGASRVVTRLFAELLTLRPANADDDRLLFEWVNDPDVRARAFSRNRISWETHSSWFADRLADQGSHLWIASDPSGAPVGQVRFETSADTTEMAVSVARGARGKGWGAAVIDAGARRLFAETDVEWVLARVKPDNSTSMRAFESADFDFDGEGSDAENTWVRYARHRDARGS